MAAKGSMACVMRLTLRRPPRPTVSSIGMYGHPTILTIRSPLNLQSNTAITSAMSPSPENGSSMTANGGLKKKRLPFLTWPGRPRGLQRKQPSALLRGQLHRSILHGGFEPRLRVRAGQGRPQLASDYQCARELLLPHWWAFYNPVQTVNSCPFGFWEHGGGCARIPLQ